MSTRRRLAWPLLVLGLAMCVSAAWLMIAGEGLSFSNDELFYFAHWGSRNGVIEPISGFDYFLAPSNGHLVFLGKLIYQFLFALFGGDYAAFRAVNVATVMATVALFFELARRRVGPLPALLGCVSLLFLGFAWEPLLWAFDIHTTLALALGLAAILAIERRDLLGDALACLLLVLATALIELGLAFVVGIAVAILLAPGRLRRLWVVTVPILLYAAWWIWAREFGQQAIFFSNSRLFAADVAESLIATVGSITGVNSTGPGAYPPLTGITAAAAIPTAVAVAAFLYRATRAPLPRSTWVFLAVALSYWGLIAVGARAADSSRYLFVDAVLVLLIAADSLRGVRIPRGALIAAACVVAIAIPANVAKLYDGRGPQRHDGEITRTEWSMLELARGKVRPLFAPGNDPQVQAAGGVVFTTLDAADYFRAADENGSLAFSLGELEEKSPQVRHVADATLARALRLRLRPVGPPRSPGGCSVLRPPGGAAAVEFVLPPPGILLGAVRRGPVTVALRRFGEPGEGFVLAKIAAGGWGVLRAPADADPRPWHVVIGGPIRRCPRPSPG